MPDKGQPERKVDFDLAGGFTWMGLGVGVFLCCAGWALVTYVERSCM